jgi:hypothetical protein
MLIALGEAAAKGLPFRLHLSCVYAVCVLVYIVYLRSRVLNYTVVVRVSKGKSISILKLKNVIVDTVGHADTSAAR